MPSPNQEGTLAVEDDPPDAINDIGRQTIDLLKRWHVHRDDGGAAMTTMLALFGKQTPIGRVVWKWSTAGNEPYSGWLAEIAYANGARLSDMQESLPRSRAAVEVIKYAVHREGRKLPKMSFQTHLSLLGYYREERELLYEIQSFVDRAKAKHLGMRLFSLENVISRLEEKNVRIMSPKVGRP